MEYRRTHRPTSPGAVPQEYERTATPVFLVNENGSRRREDTDDSGAQQRRAQKE